MIRDGNEKLIMGSWRVEERWCRGREVVFFSLWFVVVLEFFFLV